MPALENDYSALLLLEDGHIFFGNFVGKNADVIGELCFTTSMVGYQHVLTDPSYAGQLVVFTFPHIGNVGVNKLDNQSNSFCVRGFIIRDYPVNSYHHQYNLSLEDWAEKNEVVGICGVDTRFITRHIRKFGVQGGVICSTKSSVEYVRSKMEGSSKVEDYDLVSQVISKKRYIMKCKTNSTNGTIVIIDFGVKSGIINNFTDFDVVVIPGIAGFFDVALGYNPVGIVLSNGPGSPDKIMIDIKPDIEKLMFSGIPVLAICLGHQIISLVLGCQCLKMSVGHRGSNHPILSLEDGAIFISSQNHGFVVDKSSISEHVDVTHISLFDGSIEGFKVKGKPIYSYQYHPEGGPGTNDCIKVFKEFQNVITR